MPPPSLIADHASELERIFEEHAGEDKKLQPAELTPALVAMGVQLTPAEMRDTLARVDADGDGELDFDEFASIFEIGSLREVFDEMDADKSGFIDEHELRLALNELGYQASKRDVLNMMSRVDADGDGNVDFDEFRACFANVPLASLEVIAKQWTSLGSIEVGDIAPPIPPKGMPVWIFLLAGGCAGVAARTATAPLEKIKIVAQTGGGKVDIGAEFMRVWRTGGLRGLYAGNLANCIRTFPYLGITTAVYKELLKLTPADDEVDMMEPVYRGACAAAGGIVGQAFTYPMDVVRARLTLDDTGRMGIVQAFRDIYTREGPRAFYRGFYATCQAVAPFLAVQLPTLDILKALANDRGIPVDTTFLLCGGAFAGALAQTVVYPLDVLRRRLQVGGAASANIVADSTWLALRGIVEREGFRSLFAGIVPTYVKVMPATGIGMTTCNLMVMKYDEMRQQKR